MDLMSWDKTSRRTRGSKVTQKRQTIGPKSVTNSFNSWGSLSLTDLLAHVELSVFSCLVDPRSRFKGLCPNQPCGCSIMTIMHLIFNFMLNRNWESLTVNCKHGSTP